MKLVLLESPYFGDIKANLAYARLCLADSLASGEAPFASHLLYTQVLEDQDTEERLIGLDAGLEWGHYADVQAFYTDLGWSRGMLAALAFGRQHDWRQEFRSLYGTIKEPLL